MTDLHERLLAAIDAEERTTRNACAGPWSYDSQTGMVSAPHGRVVSPLFDADGHHIAAQDPATTLRRLAIYRRSLERHYADPECEGADCLEVCELAEALGIDP